MVIGDIEKAVPFQSEWLVNLKIKTNFPHWLFIKG